MPLRKFFRVDDATRIRRRTTAPTLSKSLLLAPSSRWLLITYTLQQLIDLRWQIFVVVTSIFLLSLSGTTNGQASGPSQGCKLIRKFTDATGEVDMRLTFAEGQMDDFLRQNPSIGCIAWRIVGYDREAIRIQFREFNVSSRASTLLPGTAPSDQQTCLSNTLYIKDSDTALAKERPAVSTIIGPYCGILHEPIYWWSNGNDIIIEYHIRSPEQAKRDKLKFQFSVLTPLHGCGYEAIVYSPSSAINVSTGEISSPFDRSLASHSRCYWSLSAPEEMAFHVEFIKYDIDASAPFILTINDVTDPSTSDDGSTIIGPRCCESSTTLSPSNSIKALDAYEDLQCICLAEKPPPVHSASNTIHIYYESRSMLTNVNQGFSLKWRHVHRPRPPSTSTSKSTSTSTSTPLPAKSTLRPRSDYEYLYEDLGMASTTRHIDPDDDDGNFSLVTPYELTSDVVPLVQEQTTSQPPNIEVGRTVGIPIIYIDEDEVSDSPSPSRAARQRLTTEEMEQLTDDPYRDSEEANYPKKVSDGPVSMFGASSRRKPQPNKCASYDLSFAPLLFNLGWLVALILF